MDAHRETSLYLSAQARAIDAAASQSFGIPSFELMTRAGHAAYRIIRERFPLAQRIVVVCGPGNNGGDGYVLARLLKEAARDVRVLSLDGRLPAEGDAARAARLWMESGGRIDLLSAPLPSCDLLVDALFGIGLNRALSSSGLEAVRAINAMPAPKLALDIPSGLNADTGIAMGDAVVADLTVTFIVAKLGLYTGSGKRLSGEVVVEQLNLPPEVVKLQVPSAELLARAWLAQVLLPRPSDSHKSSFGHVLVVGGELGMGGAVRLCGEAALRAGAGLVSVATRPEHVAPILAARPELMVRGVTQAAELRPMVKRASVIVVGPGLGLSPWSQSLLQTVAEANVRTLIDADALTMLADGACLLPEHLVITPHPGEAARLLEQTTAQVQADRLQALRELVRAFEACVVLKGSGTLLGAPGSLPAVCPFGHAALATAGTGDVLAGLIAGLWAQGLDAFSAARAGVLVHALASERFVGKATRGMLALDLMAALLPFVNPQA